MGRLRWFNPGWRRPVVFDGQFLVGRGLLIATPEVIAFELAERHAATHMREKSVPAETQRGKAEKSLRLRVFRGEIFPLVTWKLRGDRHNLTRRHEAGPRTFRRD